MSAKASQISITGQPTPVIIKVGGDTADTYNVESNVQSPVTIDSPLMDFHDPHPGPTWTSAKSQKKGRIKELTIKEGIELHDFPINPDEQLASVTIQYGSVELIIREIGVAPTDVHLEFVSDQVPFTAKTEPDWSDASAMFPQVVSGVVFKQGNRVILHKRYPVPSPDLTFNIDFHRTKPR
jgi:hypothetical protein